MATKIDLPFQYVDEKKTYSNYYLLGTTMTTTGSLSYTSSSSGTTYTTSNGGQYAIFQQLQTLLSPYDINALDFNSKTNNIITNPIFYAL